MEKIRKVYFTTQQCVFDALVKKVGIRGIDEFLTKLLVSALDLECDDDGDTRE